MFGDIVVISVLVLIIGLIVRGMIRNYKSGKHCGGCTGCSACAHRGQCGSCGSCGGCPSAKQ